MKRVRPEVFRRVTSETARAQSHGRELPGSSAEVVCPALPPVDCPRRSKLAVSGLPDVRASFVTTLAASIGRRSRVFPAVLVGALLALSPGCIVIPIGDLLKPQSLEEHVLVRGRGFLSKEKVAVIEINGMISSDKGFGLISTSHNAVAEMRSRLLKIRSDRQVKAIVLRISSPGGEVTACDLIHRQLLKFKEETGIPIVASIVEQGASGAYYIAMAADRVFTHPTAIVGSIGVILHSFDASDLLASVGVRAVPIKSSDKKDINSLFRPMSADERQVLQDLVDDMYEQFLGVVERGRVNLSADQVRELADGRVFSGIESARLGLADATGYLADAIDSATEMAAISSPTVIHYTRAGSSNTRLEAAFHGQAGDRQDVELSLRARSLKTSPKLYYVWHPGL